MKRLVLLLLSIVLSSAYGQDFETIKQAAEQGDADAQFNLGSMYYGGRGIDENIAEAVKWYTLAAKQGYIPAQKHLGGMYANGKGVHQNIAEAIKWYTLAAEQGDATAQTNLSIIYANGGEGITPPVTPPSQNTTSLNDAKNKCAELGYTMGTEKFGECVLKLSK